jgi:hypothetical protein
VNCLEWIEARLRIAEKAEFIQRMYPLFVISAMGAFIEFVIDEKNSEENKGASDFDKNLKWIKRSTKTKRISERI